MFQTNVIRSIFNKQFKVDNLIKIGYLKREYFIET